jgi:hypothetical protein
MPQKIGDLVSGYTLQVQNQHLPGSLFTALHAACILAPGHCDRETGSREADERI